jgi:hypothetical protein
MYKAWSNESLKPGDQVTIVVNRNKKWLTNHAL